MIERVYIGVGVDKKIVHRKCIGKVSEDTPVKVSMDKYSITIGCSTISVEAAKLIMGKWQDEFEKPNEFRKVTMQEGFNGATAC